MKKSIIATCIALILCGGSSAQTQRLNRTNTRTHDRSDATNNASAPGRSTDQQNRNRPDRTNHENDMDRNNTNNNTNTTPNSTGTRTGNTNTNTGTGTNGVNTNGGTGTNGSNIHSNNPR